MLPTTSKVARPVNALSRAPEATDPVKTWMGGGSGIWDLVSGIRVVGGSPGAAAALSCLPVGRWN
jgi:hypothetical protein